MTQFFLVEAPAPYSAFPDLAFTNVEGDPFLAESASVVFSAPRGSVWSVAPPLNEVGALACDARDALSAGSTVHQTQLGRLVAHAVNQRNRFCMFYADDQSSLPMPATVAGLFAELEAQLRASTDSNLELYVQWAGAA